MVTKCSGKSAACIFRVEVLGLKNHLPDYTTSTLVFSPPGICQVPGGEVNCIISSSKAGVINVTGVQQVGSLKG